MISPKIAAAFRIGSAHSGSESPYSGSRPSEIVVIATSSKKVPVAM